MRAVFYADADTTIKDEEMPQNVSVWEKVIKFGEIDLSQETPYGLKFKEPALVVKNGKTYLYANVEFKNATSYQFWNFILMNSQNREKIKEALDSGDKEILKRIIDDYKERMRDGLNIDKSGNLILNTTVPMVFEVDEKGNLNEWIFIGNEAKQFINEIKKEVINRKEKTRKIHFIENFIELYGKERLADLILENAEEFINNDNFLAMYLDREKLREIVLRSLEDIVKNPPEDKIWYRLKDILTERLRINSNLKEAFYTDDYKELYKKSTTSKELKEEILEYAIDVIEKLDPSMEKIFQYIAKYGSPTDHYEAVDFADLLVKDYAHQKLPEIIEKATEKSYPELFDWLKLQLIRQREYEISIEEERKLEEKYNFKRKLL
jgi:hypothetical protein